MNIYRGVFDRSCDYDDFVGSWKAVFLFQSVQLGHRLEDQASMFYYFCVLNPHGFAPFNPLQLAVTKHIQCEIV